MDEMSSLQEGNDIWEVTGERRIDSYPYYWAPFSTKLPPFPAFLLDIYYWVLLLAALSLYARFSFSNKM